jgi:hypothetical protein
VATVTVTAPVAGYTGHVIGIEFKSGRATVDRSELDALAYFRRHGYGLSGLAGTADSPEPPDPREVGEGGSGTEVVGTRLRDAAVDPRPADFLPPTNAGQANPHGPLVVAPGLHATPPAPIVPGPVSSDAKEQEAVETAAAAATLVEQEPADAEQLEAERPSTKPRGRKQQGR